MVPDALTKVCKAAPMASTGLVHTMLLSTAKSEFPKNQSFLHGIMTKHIYISYVKKEEGVGRVAPTTFTSRALPQVIEWGTKGQLNSAHMVSIFWRKFT